MNAFSFVATQNDLSKAMQLGSQNHTPLEELRDQKSVSLLHFTLQLKEKTIARVERGFQILAPQQGSNGGTAISPSFTVVSSSNLDRMFKTSFSQSEPLDRRSKV